MEFQFTFACPPTPATVPTVAPEPSTSAAFSFASLMTTFNPSGRPRTARAESQARYRARNVEVECEKARGRTQKNREWREAERVRRAASSERLRSTDLFSRYKQHVQAHVGGVYRQDGETDAEFWAAFDRLCFYDPELPTAGSANDLPFPTCDREDALFVLQHKSPGGRPAQPDEDEIDKCLRQLNSPSCTLVLAYSWEDEEAVAAHQRIRDHGAAPMDDEDYEFMFRHAVPTPTFGNMDGCLCR